MGRCYDHLHHTSHIHRRATRVTSPRLPCPSPRSDALAKRRRRPGGGDSGNAAGGTYAARNGGKPEYNGRHQRWKWKNEAERRCEAAGEVMEAEVEEANEAERLEAEAVVEERKSGRVE